MRRNPDILRDIMLAAEKQPAGQPLHSSDIKTVSDNPREIVDHVQQLIDIGYVDGTAHLHEPPVGSTAVIRRIRGPGHDFLQAMRDDTIWKMAKEKVMKPAASWTLALAVEWAKRYAAEKLGLS